MGSLPEPEPSIQPVLSSLLNGISPSLVDRSSPSVASRTSVPTSISKPYDAKYFPKQEPWDPFRPVKIVVVGAGIGGVAAAVLLSKKVRNATISTYEKNSRVGGTWAANVYPGVRCDVPSHLYQLSFAPNPNWSEYYPKGAEIQQYYEKVVDDHGLTPNFHLQHEVLRATWLKDASQWAIEVRDLQTGTVIVETADFFVSSQGRIHLPSFPDVPGLLDVFKGDVVHTARWPANFEYTGKRVAIIGNGASGQQLLPNIVQDVEHIDHYVRTKTWVTPSFAKDLWVATADAPGGPAYTEEQKQLFRDDPQAYVEYRRRFELVFQSRFPGGDVLGSKENAELRERIIACMRERLDNDEEWLQRVIPDYAPGCKRLTPAPGYLEALKGPKVDFVTDRIVQVDETGIITADGKHRPVDAIIAATGFKQAYTSLFPVIGPDGIDIRDKWATDGPICYPWSYLGVMAPGYPNYFTVLQAQANARGGTVPLQTELSSTWIAKAIRKAQGQGYTWLDPREDAAYDFNTIVNGFFDNKVSSDNCRSWAKQGLGQTRNLLAWPGSYHHRALALRDPRWEDFKFGKRPRTDLNRFEYFGNGTTTRDKDGDENELTRYLVPIGKIDLETHHELWNE